MDKKFPYHNILIVCSVNTARSRLAEGFLKDFFSKLDIPLGRVFDLAVSITNNEITIEHFNKDDWMLEYGAEIQIEKHKPYPDTIYSLTKHNLVTDEDYIFNFAVQGLDTVSLAGRPEQTKKPLLLTCSGLNAPFLRPLRDNPINASCDPLKDSVLKLLPIITRSGCSS